MKVIAGSIDEGEWSLLEGDEGEWRLLKVNKG